MASIPFQLNSNPAVDAFAVTPSDTVNYAQGMARGLYVGTAGAVSLVTAAGNTVVFPDVPAGSFLPVCSVRVNATGTAASGLVALL